MMQDVTAEVARLRARRDQARDNRVRAEHDREQAEQQVTQAIAALRDEFGIETPQQAEQMRAALEEELAAEKRKIEEALG